MKRLLALIFSSAILIIWAKGSTAGQSTFGEPPENMYSALISDDLFLYSSSVLSFDTQAFLNTQPGPLKDYAEEVYDQSWSASEIVDYYAWRYGINPQLILVLLEAEYEILSNPATNFTDYFGTEKPNHTFYDNLSNSSELLLKAYQEKQHNEDDGHLISPNGEIVTIQTQINASTYAIQTFLGTRLTQGEWELWIMGDKPLFVEQFSQWFGNPNDIPVAIETPSALPDGYILPFSVGETWYYTSGPHNYFGGDVGCVSEPGCPRPWSSIDIASAEIISCPGGSAPSNRWITSAREGIVEQANNALVVIDHGDNWRTYYLHLDGIIVQEDTEVAQGERLGHPSCMGGDTTGVHVHFALWQEGNGFVDIDESILSNWKIQETTHYNGKLINNDVTKDAYSGRDFDINGIPNLPYNDNFNTDNLSPNWFWIREDPSHWYFTNPLGYLTIITQQKDIWQYNTSAPLLLQELKEYSSDSFEISTRVEITPTEDFHQGGLLIYEDDDNHMRLTYGHMDKIRIEFAREINGVFENLHTSPPLNVNDFHLKIVKLNSTYIAHFSLDGENWMGAGVWENVPIIPNSIGITAFNGAESSTPIEIPARFDYFQMLDARSIYLPMIVK